jgi:hypothetical protein
VKLGQIALKIRLAETRFDDRIGGAAELAYALAKPLNEEMAFVIPLGEAADSNQYDTSINQNIVERCGIVVALNNDTERKDRYGIVAYDLVHDVRTEIFSAILGWNPEETTGSFLYYRGGRLLEITRAFLWYQFEFERTLRITDSDGYDNEYDKLQDFNEIWTDYIVTGRDLPYEGSLPLTNPDMSDLTDESDDEQGGAFSKEFASGFDWYKRE